MVPTFRWAACLVLLTIATFAPAQSGKYAVKTVKADPPKDLNEAIGKLLSPQSVQLLDKQGRLVAELWFRKEVPTDATPEQIKNGVTYRELKQTEILGAIRFDQDWTDYRKQKVKAGVYTLRLGFQPVDGDHTGASQFTEFLLVLSAAKDTKADLMDPKEMIEMSEKSINTGHPGVFMLFPNTKPGAEPRLLARPSNHWVLDAKEAITVGGKKAGTIGIGLTLVGNAG